MDWRNAKYGAIGVKRFARMHVAHALGGMPCAAAVTPDKANGSPYPGTMMVTMPRGSGYVPADTQYGVENCRAKKTADAAS